MTQPSVAIYAGSFDPMTYGHFDVVKRAAQLFPRLIVAVGRHPTRSPLFTLEERMDMIRGVCAEIENVEVSSFGGLLADYAREVGARVVVRGLRVGADFEYELQIAHANADLAPEVDTLFLPTRTAYGFISASLVRDIARHGGDISRYAPELVVGELKKKFQKP
jgi:pantetheine-phosphate adenylyltransferase